MAYNLERRSIELTGGKLVTEFFYTGLNKANNAYAKDINELNDVDAENMRFVMKLTGAQKDLEILSKSIKHLGSGVGIVENRKNLLETLYFNVYDLVFKWMNQLLFETMPDLGTLKGGKDSYITLETAYDKCLVPILENMAKLVNMVIEIRFPSGVSKLATTQAQEKIDLNTKATTQQIEASKPKSKKTKGTKGTE